MPTALIVDDEPAANQLLAMLMELRGYATESAFTGAEAIAMIDRCEPDVILLDLMLPDMSGYQVCEAVKTRKHTTLIPVIMVTARVATQNRAESFALGADGYVSKPYTPDQLFEAIAAAEAWQQRALAEPLEASSLVRFAAGDDDESLRELAQLRSVVFSQTPLPIDAVQRVDEALQAIRHDAESWGRAQGVLSVATVDFRALHNCMILTLRAPSGWLSDPGRPPAARCADAIERAGFDAISTDLASGTMTLVKEFTNPAN
jgi:CheY-like chemotaxis protein